LAASAASGDDNVAKLDCGAIADRLSAYGGQLPEAMKSLSTIAGTDPFSNYSPGRLVISANSGGHGNTNYYFDDGGAVFFCTNGAAGVLATGASTNAVTYVSPTGGHVYSGTDVAGFASWGVHGFNETNAAYATNGTIVFTGDSGWYIIQTAESFNGQRCDPGQGTFLKWFSANAFGGTNYASTPIGAVSHVEEPYIACLNDPYCYFGLWAQNKNFAICAWDSRRTCFFQAVGDPFVKR
jgi:hypothetical protein